jgi:hypothetical protein
VLKLLKILNRKGACVLLRRDEVALSVLEEGEVTLFAEFEVFMDEAAGEVVD